VVWPGPVYFPDLLPGEWDESEHPRHPRGSSRGGRFRETGGVGGWVAAVSTAIRSPEQDLLDLVSGELVERAPLYGGQMGATSIVTFREPDGSRRRVVHKDYSRGPAGTAGQRASIAKEVLANRIGQILGARAPVAIVDPDNDAAMYMELLDGRTPMELAGGDPEVDFQNEFDEDRLDDLEQEHMRTPSGRRIGLLDLLLYHQDRHAGNWLVLTDGTAAAIDNADVILEGDGYEAAFDPLMIHWGGGSPFTGTYLDGRGDLLEIEDLSPAEAARIRARLVALFDDPDVQRQLMLANNSPGLLAMYHDEPLVGAKIFIDGLLRRWDAIAAMARGAD